MGRANYCGNRNGGSVLTSLWPQSSVHSQTCPGTRTGLQIHHKADNNAYDHIRFGAPRDNTERIGRVHRRLLYGSEVGSAEAATTPAAPPSSPGVCVVAATVGGGGADEGVLGFCFDCGVCLPDDPFFGIGVDVPDCGSTYSYLRESSVNVTGPCIASPGEKAKMCTAASAFRNPSLQTH